jgi:hypothetical protein
MSRFGINPRTNEAALDRDRVAKLMLIVGDPWGGRRNKHVLFDFHTDVPQCYGRQTSRKFICTQKQLSCNCIALHRIYFKVEAAKTHVSLLSQLFYYVAQYRIFNILSVYKYSSKLHNMWANKWSREAFKLLCLSLNCMVNKVDTGQGKEEAKSKLADH